jgi:hypothetical protein
MHNQQVNGYLFCDFLYLSERSSVSFNNYSFRNSVNHRFDSKYPSRYVVVSAVCEAISRFTMRLLTCTSVHVLVSSLASAPRNDMESVMY